MRRDTEIGIIVGIVLAIIIGVFISTRTGVKEPTIPLSDIYEEENIEDEALDLGILTQQPLPDIAGLPEEIPEDTVPAPKRQPPAQAIIQDEQDEDEWEDEVIEGEWEEIELPPTTVVEETKPAPAEFIEPIEPVVAIHPEEDIAYKVKPNDTLTKLARQYYGDEAKWTLIYDANAGKISHRNALYIGQEIIIPSDSASVEESVVVEPLPSPPSQAVVAPEDTDKRTHTVQKGDTLIKLARQYYNNEAGWKKIYEANKDIIPNPNTISQGTVLIIPE
ncbi:MAG: LysM peptidoglycan-binding domain-containing protein [Candidatus Brocadiales bacterium]